MKNDVYVLAHEMKNPLCVAKGYLEMMNKSNLDKYKEIIKEEINMSLEILDNYLSYDKIMITGEEIDLNVLLEDIKNNMNDYLNKCGVNLKVILKDDEIYLKADYHKLKQVFYNIIKNAVEGEAKNIIVTYKVIYNQIKIIIRNDGMRINNLDEIGHNYSNKVLGHGIGTFLSQKIIHLHDGKITYKNELRGCFCDITLPI